jgi:hypothetical protein
MQRHAGGRGPINPLLVVYLLSVAAAADEFQLNSYTPGDQVGVGIATMPSGDFVAVWQGASPGNDQSDFSVQARRFSAIGVPLGPEFQVNTYTPYFQGEPSVGMGPSGEFIVTWRSRKANAPPAPPLDRHPGP